MSTIVWEVIDKTHCVYTGQAADLLEQRLYFDDPMPDVGRPFKVLARKCSLATECNLAGFSCKWAYTNPDRDPFAEQR